MLDKIRSFIPNILTLANLACGCLALISLFAFDFKTAAYLVGASLIFDFLDGFVARLLKVHSELGKQLDSLADMVTFGVVPGFLMFKLFEYMAMEGVVFPEYLKYSTLAIPLFSALRLAKFNIDTRQATYFIGMPTPANAIFLFAVALSVVHGVYPWLHSVWVLSIIALVCSVLLIAELPLMSLKIKRLSWKEAKGQMILLLMVLILFMIFGFKAMVFIIPLYLGLSIVFKPQK